MIVIILGLAFEKYIPTTYETKTRDLFIEKEEIVRHSIGFPIHTQILARFASNTI